MKKENLMRKEYDFSKGERGRFFGKVDTSEVILDEDETLDEVFSEELSVLEFNLSRIERLKTRFSELDAETQTEISKRISEAINTLDKIALKK